MGSGTSFFNRTLYEKTMARFWPLWVVYGFIWLFLMPFSLLNTYFQRNLLPENEVYEVAINIPGMLRMGVWIAAVYGLLCAMAVFSYLYSSRSSCMMHALPIRREGLFLTHYLAGLSFLLLPHLVVAALTAMAEVCLLPTENWRTALGCLLTWLLAQSGNCLFFFSFAVFCAMFTGHILALPIFYGILNCLVTVMYELVSSLMRQYLYGFVMGSESAADQLVRILTPIYELSRANRRGYAANQTLYELYRPKVILLYAVVGVVLALVAMWVYTQRHMETAGDVVAVPIMRPVFKYGVAFCAGVAFGTETAYFMSWDGKPVVLTICVLIWSVVGYFAAEMLLQKSFRVWKKWPGALVTMGVMGALCLCLVMDVFGVVAKVPQAQDVAYVTAGRFGYPYDGGNGWEQVTDEEEIEKFLALHRAILAEKDVTRDSYENALYGFELSYVLKNGSVISRRYSFVPLVKSEIDQVGTVTWCANQILQDRDLVAQFYDLDEAEQGSLNNVWLEDVYNGETHDEYDEVDVGEMAEANLYTLWKAVRQDFAEGNIGKCYLFSDEEMYRECYQSQIYFNWVKTGTGKNSTESESRYITLTYAAKNTLKWLEENGILGEDYQLMEYAGYEENEKETIYYTH